MATAGEAAETASLHAESGGTHASRRSVSVAASAWAKCGRSTTGRKYSSSPALLGDQAADKPLASQAAEDHRRRPSLGGDEIRGQPAQSGDGQVGDGSEAADEKIADARAHGRGADDDGERSQGVVALELGDALAERVFELRETAADEQPLVCVGPAGHGRGERITRSGRVRAPLPQVSSRMRSRVLRMLGEQGVPVRELEVGEVESGRHDAADERPGVLRRQVRAARKAGALPAAGRHERLRQPAGHALRQADGGLGRRRELVIAAADELLEISEHAPQHPAVRRDRHDLKGKAALVHPQLVAAQPVQPARPTRP